MIDAGKLFDSFHLIYFIWLITYDSFDFYDSCILVDIRMDIIWQWLQFILIDFAHSLVFKKKIQPHSYNTRLILILYEIFNWDVLHMRIGLYFWKTNTSPAKLTNSISSVFSFWQIRWKMTLDLRLVTNHFFFKNRLIPWTRETFWNYNYATL